MTEAKASILGDALMFRKSNILLTFKYVGGDHVAFSAAAPTVRTSGGIRFLLCVLD
jgi:hypothetical protein